MRFPNMIADCFSSWHHNARPKEGGEEEAGSCQSTQDAYLGQAMKNILCTHHLCVTECGLGSIVEYIINLEHSHV